MQSVLLGSPRGQRHCNARQDAGTTLDNDASIKEICYPEVPSILVLSFRPELFTLVQDLCDLGQIGDCIPSMSHQEQLFRIRW